MNMSKTRLKSAYELATERIIESRYRPIKDNTYYDDDNTVDDLRADDSENIPDFVDLEPDLKPHVEPDLELDAINIEEVENNFSEDGRMSVQDVMNNIRSIRAKRDQVSEALENMKPIELQWYGHFTSYSGFSRMNRAMVFGLSNRNVRIKIDPQPCAVEINEATTNELNILEKMQVNPNCPKVFGATIPLNMFHGGRKILYTMMESSSLHKDYVEKLNLYDEVWIPTKQGIEMCKRDGVKVPLYHMPLGVDIDRYTPLSEDDKFNINLQLNKFVFLSVFKWGFRKGYDLLLKAYMQEFSSEEDVSLLIVSRTDVNHDKSKIQNDFINIRNTIQKDDDMLPHIVLCDEFIPERKMPFIYKSANAFVLLSRGEGFGLPYYEAAATGLPIIGTFCSGQTDLLNDDNSFLVHPKDYYKANRLSPIGKVCRFYEDQSFPDFNEESIKQAREHMRSVFNNYGQALHKANKIYKQVQEYTWKNAVNSIYRRLIEIGE